MPRGMGKKQASQQKDILGVGLHGRSPLIVYREQNKKGVTELFLQKSANGTRFDRPRKKLKCLTERGSIEPAQNLHSFTVHPISEGAFITYVRTKGNKQVRVGAISKTLSGSRVRGKIGGGTSFAFVPGVTSKGRFVGYLEEDSISALYTKDFKKWTKVKTAIRGGVLWGAVSLPQGILVLVDRSKESSNGTHLRIEAFLCNVDNPSELVWSGESFLFEEVRPNPTEPLGAILGKEGIRIYWKELGEVHTAEIPLPFEDPLRLGPASLSKPHHLNPILAPKAENHWEAVATFNPAALFDGERVHLLYRAIGHNNMSTVGYATSTDGLNFTERLNYPIYTARTPSEGTYTLPWEYTHEYTSGGGGFGGCEDPRITLIDGKVYMTYVAYNGFEAPRVAITSIDFSDFKSGNWKWTQPLLISRPHQVNKNAAILPEKINGSYVIFHRVFPDMLIDFVPDLEFRKRRWLVGEHKISPRPSLWDSRKLGVGPSPIATDAGWLVIYQGVDDRDPGRYKMGAMILDRNDPTQVLYRTRLPIAVPDSVYENEGHKWGVIYPCGAAVVRGELYVYYGGADRVTCVAHTPLDAFIDNIKKDSVVSLSTEKIIVR